ncbi:MAG: hypothetical protein WBM40_06765 [Thiohalocapsa sp.]
MAGMGRGDETARTSKTLLKVESFHPNSIASLRLIPTSRDCRYRYRNRSMWRVASDSIPIPIPISISASLASPMRHRNLTRLQTFAALKRSRKFQTHRFPTQ